MKRFAVAALLAATGSVAFDFNQFFILAKAQKRFTAVGLVAAKTSAMWETSFKNSGASLVFTSFAPNATPIAAATPIAGAPRIFISLIIRATSS